MNNQTSAYVNVVEIKASYAPYNKFAAFEQGYADYMNGTSAICSSDDVDGQAYDRGCEAAMKVRRAAGNCRQAVVKKGGD